MAHFPDPIVIPEVTQLRQERLHELVSSSLRGIAIRFAIILAEVLGVIFLGSAVLMMDALSSLIDIIASIILVVCIKYAARPPDDNHPFGHGRFEPLVGFQMGLFMALIGLGMLLQQAFALSEEHKGGEIHPYVWVIPLGAVVLLEICYQIVMYTARKERSSALAVDAVHYRIDGMTSLFAAVALIAAAYFPKWGGIIDHWGAMIIAFLMIVIGGDAVRRNFNQIIDRAPERHFFELIQKAAKGVEGVLGTEKIRIQAYGPDAHVDIDVEVDPNLTVEVSHVISQKVRAEIQKVWPQVQDVIVHIEPFYPGDH